MNYQATVVIKATAEKVWEILTDGSKYQEWDPNVIRLEGRIGLNEKVTVYTKLSPNRAFPVKVVVFEPNKKMVWRGGFPLGFLFKGERTFTLTDMGSGVTKVRTEEQFSGILLPLIGRTIPDLGPSFEGFAQGLKVRAEGA